MSGLKLAALYGINPHLLGYCGPQERSETKVLLNYLSGQKIPEQKIRKILEKFEGAVYYYKLIAKSSGIKDYFDERVVRAYWIGNSLLEKVKIGDLRKVIAGDFSRPGLLTKEKALEKAQEIPENSIPHHNFHVLAVGSVTGRIKLKGKLIDTCRVSWGKVKKIKTCPVPNRRLWCGVGKEEAKVRVTYQPLAVNKKFKLGKAVEKEILWDKIFYPKVKAGDWVSIHWGHLIQAISEKDSASLQKYTKIIINSLNEK